MPQPQLINAEYKEKFTSLTEKLGRCATTKDKEYWDISEWYKNQYDVERIKRQKEEYLERAAERKLAANPVKLIEKLCKTCEKIIPSGRADRCKECIEQEAEKKKLDKSKGWKCISCDNMIYPTGKRGKPAKSCADCRASKGK